MPSIQYYNSVVGEQVKVIGQNVGIGTSTPSAKLNVENGNLVFNDLGGNFDFRVEGDTDANLLFTDASTDRVGIGTSTPQAKLDVNGTVQFDNLVRWEFPDKPIDTNISALGYLRLYDESSTYCGLGVSSSSFNIGSVGGINLRFLTNGTERTIIDTNGNFIFNEAGNNCDFRIEGDTDPNLLFVDASTDRVGISTAGPDVKLQVNESVVDDNGYVYDTNACMIVHPTSTSTTVLNDPKETLYIARQGTAGQSYGAAAAFSLSRYENSSTNSRTRLDIDLAHGTFLNSKTNVMTMRSDGNIGIGASQPSQKLDVNGRVKANLFITQDPKSATNLPIGWYTIAVNIGNRAIGRFGLTCESGGRHQGIIFYASHYYGLGNQISILHNNRYSGSNPISRIRIKEGGTYDGCLLQIYIDDANNTPTVYLLNDNISTAGWNLVALTADGTNPGGVSNFANLNNVAVEVDLDSTDFGTNGKSSFQGNVGIGTTSQTTARLNVEGGNIIFNDSGGDFDFRVEGNDDQNLFICDASSNNVGIGVQSPFSKLHIRSEYGTAIPLLIDDSSPIATGVGGGITFGGLYNSQGSYFDFAEIKSLRETANENNPSASLGFYTTNDFSILSEKMRIQSDGDVGIGTPIPGYKLDVNGTFSANSVNINDQFTFPTTDGSSGQALVTNGSGVVSWTDVASGSANLTRGSFEVTSTQSVFTVSGGYTLNTLSVYYNGIKLLLGTDFTATNGTTFTLTNAAVNGDIVEYWSLNSASSAVGNTSTGSVSVTSNQTVFNVTNGYTVGGLIVFVNGVKLVDGVDFTATNGSSFTLTSTATSGDVVDYVAYGAVVASSNLQKTGDTMTGNLTIGNGSDLIVEGDLIVAKYKEGFVDGGNSSTSKTIDITSGTLQTVTLTDNCTFTMPSVEAGRSFTLLLKTGTGSFTSTFTGVKWPSDSAPTITTTASKLDILTFVSDGTNWYGNIAQNYSV